MGAEYSQCVCVRDVRAVDKRAGGMERRGQTDGQLCGGWEECIVLYY